MVIRNELRTGLLVALTAAVLAAALIYLEAPGLAGERRIFRIYFDNAGGINAGAPVMLAGRKIGQVSRLLSPIPESQRPRPDLAVIVEVVVDRSALIYREERVNMLQFSLLGEQVIDFTRGNEASGRATADTRFIGERQPGLADVGQKVLDKLDPVVGSATLAMLDLQKTCSHLTEITQQGSDLVLAIANFRQFGEQLLGISGPDGTIQHTFNNLKALTGKESPLANALDNAEKFTGDLKDNKDIRTYNMMPWAFLTLMMNNAWGVTANLEIRRAIQAALDLEEVAAIASDGLYRLDPAWQYPGTNYYPGADGLDAYVRQDLKKAQARLAAAGYKGEELQIIADSSIKVHLDAATVVAEQLRGAGFKVKLTITDWPTVNASRVKPEGWNLWPLSMGIEPYEGPYNVVGFFAGKAPVQISHDPVIDDAAAKLGSQLKLEDRRAAVAAFQARMYDQAIAVKVGDTGLVQATRANVMNYAPYRIPRMWDCWFA